MNSMRLIIFFGVMLLLIVMMELFFLSRWKKFCKTHQYNKYLYVVPYWISGLMLAAYIYSNYYNLVHFPVPEHIKWFNIATSFWYLPKILIVPVLIIIEVSKKILKLFRKSEKHSIAPTSQPNHKLRKKYLGNLAWGFAGIPFILALQGLFITVNDVHIFSENIYLERLHSNHDGLRIVQISDLHFGTYMNEKALQKIKSTIHSLKPDFIFITGDFVNFRYQELDPGESFLRELKSRYGTYACLGNHDHYMSVDDHAKLIKRLRNTGIRLLINENRVMRVNNQDINIVSVDNYGSRQTFGDFDKAYSYINTKNLTILLSHDPRTWDSHVIGKRYTDLTLSGHTHGGQVAFEFLGFELSIANALYKQYKGLYNHGSQYLYVNRGLGVSGPPIRFSVYPEITLITLKKPKNFTLN